MRPALYRLERMAASARERAVEATHRALSHVLTAERTARLNRLLLPVPEGDSPDGAVPKVLVRRGLTPLSWLKEGATSNTAKRSRTRSRSSTTCAAWAPTGWT